MTPRQEDIVGGVPSLIAREYRTEDAAAALALRNSVFPPISAEDWPQSQTSAVAIMDGTLVGVIPFTVRDVEIAPGVVIRGAFANSVAVAAEYRDRGIGTDMMATAREFLPRWAEAMFVYTGGERGGPQYRFYRKTGHFDLAYPRRLWRATSAAGSEQPHGTEVLPITAVAALEAELLTVYEACYAGCAGTWHRKRGYWREALASHIFIELPYRGLWLVTQRDRDGTPLHAYALAGLRDDELIVLEAAARQENAADALWQTVGLLARDQGAHAIVLYGQDLTTPLYASVRRAGFHPEARAKVVVGRALSSELICARRWEVCPTPPAITLHVWTPERSLTLRQAAGGVILTLEMKEETLHQFLFARVDLEAAVREQRVTVREGTWEAVRHVAAVLHPVPWVYHYLDDI